MRDRYHRLCTMRDRYDVKDGSYDGHMRSAQAGLRASKWVFLVGDEEDRACREALSRDRIWFKSNRVRMNIPSSGRAVLRP